MEPAEATELARRLTDALGKVQDASDWLKFSWVLGAVAVRLGPDEAGPLARRVADALGKEKDPAVMYELAMILKELGDRMEPAGAAPLAAGAARRLADALANENDFPARTNQAGAFGMAEPWLGPAEAAAASRTRLAYALAALAARMEPKEAARLAAGVARRLAQALLAKETNAVARSTLPHSLEVLAARVGPAEAAVLARQLIDALAHEKDFGVRPDLARALMALAGRLEPAEAARLSAEAARTLTLALATETFRRYDLARALGAVAARLEPAAAGPVAQRLTEALGTEQDLSTRFQLAEALGAVAARLEPAESARLSAESARALADALGKAAFPTRALGGEAPGVVAARLEFAEAAALARPLADALGKEPGSEGRYKLAQAIRVVATRIDPAEAAPRSLLVARAAGSWLSPSPHVGNAAILLKAAEPLPCRFTTQQLVDLLKMPTCSGQARTVILELLANRYKRPFADIWEFVEWAQHHEPSLDFTSPPRRNPFR
jgi:hypothetical protein